ncbi:MAG: dephospho-CoA kinase [Bacteroidetes bacterium]|nr:dephospho-CoA kinase [Bacteroidota bacterium]
MLKMGLTGGMGSGKTTAARIFEALGIPIYYADQAAKRLMEEEAGIRSAIQQAFGTEAYQDGHLNRSWLASQVFHDPERIRRLNALVHPATLADARHWMGQQTTPYAVKEAALLFESGSEQELDLVVGVQASQETRLRRVLQRDGVTREEALNRMQRQMDEQEKMARCDRILVNEDDSRLTPQVLALHEELLHLAAKMPPFP